ncbi:MAG: response regulator [Gammaproteobacteria bacterium]|nr:response regulator [Gammaproteobacteria bacterium]
MIKPQGLSITTRLIILVLLPVVIIEALFAFYYIKQSSSSAYLALEEKGQLLSEQLASASSFYLLSGDYSQINQLINHSFNHKYVVFVSVHNNHGVAIAKHSSPQFQHDKTEQYLHFQKVITNKAIYSPDIFELDETTQTDEEIGFLHLYLSQTEINKVQKNVLKNTVISALIIFFIVFVAISVYVKSITLPIFDLIKQLKRAELGELGKTISQIESNEIGSLQIGFNQMTQALLDNRKQLDAKIQTATIKLVNSVNELEQKNIDLEISRNEAHNANKVKSEFLANMSHEIRTPVNGIKGFINLLSNSNLDREQKRYARIIKQSSTDLISIINEILDLSKIESGKLTITSHSFDLINCIESIKERFFVSATEKNIDLFLSIYSDVPRWVLGDEARLKQILTNLIGNAIKFTDHGYVQIMVFINDIEPSNSDYLIQIDIKDTGIGIDHKEKNYLFSAFHQIETSSNRRYTGTGLGLVISRKLARLLQGDIELNTDQSIGSTFSLTLPITLDKNAELEPQPPSSNDLFFLIANQKECLSEIQSLFTRANLLTETALVACDSDLEKTLKIISLSLNNIQYIFIDQRNFYSQYSETLAHTFAQKCHVFIYDYKPNSIYDHCFYLSSSTHSDELLATIQSAIKRDTENKNQPEQEIIPKKILIVDDNSINLIFAFELLTQWGHKPVKANNALQALEEFKTQNFDIVLMDIQMPVHDGTECMNMLKKTNLNTEAPIIALTANALAEEEQRLLELGFDGYLSKPIDENALLAILSNNDSPKTLHLIKQHAIPIVLKSIDYAKTKELVKNNQQLIRQIYQQLENEIPIYIDQFVLAEKNHDIALFKTTKHKLEGTTCYLSLPKLKKLLTNAITMENFENELNGEIIEELKVIFNLLKTDLVTTTQEY